jgi:hypothetical protein
MHARLACQGNRQAQPSQTTDCATQDSKVLTELGSWMLTGSPTGPGSLPQAKGLQECKGARNQEASRLLNQQPRNWVFLGRKGGDQAAGAQVPT